MAEYEPSNPNTYLAPAEHTFKLFQVRRLLMMNLWWSVSMKGRTQRYQRSDFQNLRPAFRVMPVVRGYTWTLLSRIPCLQGEQRRAVVCG